MPELIINASAAELGEFIRWAYYDCPYQIADTLNTMPIDLDELCGFLANVNRWQPEWAAYREWVMKNPA